MESQFWSVKLQVDSATRRDTDPTQQSSGCPTPAAVDGDDVIPKFQSQSVAAAGGLSQQHEPGPVRPSPMMTQARDVTDLPQDDASCPAPPADDSDVYSQELMRTMQDMARDMEWLREESDMGAWGLPPGNMVEEEDCPVFENMADQENAMTVWGIPEEMFDDCPGFY